MKVFSHIFIGLQVIDPVAPRYTALDGKATVPVLLPGVKEERLAVPKHPKNPDVGEKAVWVGPRILIDLEDAKTLKENENTTFINWGNLKISKLIRYVFVPFSFVKKVEK